MGIEPKIMTQLADSSSSMLPCSLCKDVKMFLGLHAVTTPEPA